MDYYILANPHSGHGHGQQVTDKLTAYLTQEKITYYLFNTHQPFDEHRLMMTILAQKNTDDRIIIIGGDGTISLAVNALPAEQAFSISPLVLVMILPEDLRCRLQDDCKHLIIFTRHPKRFMSLKYESETLSGIATNNFGIGLDAAIVDAAIKV